MRSEFRHASYSSSPGGNTTRRRRLVSHQTRRRCSRCRSLSGSDQFLRLHVQVHVTANVTTLSKVRLEWFSWNLSTVYVDGEEVYIVVLRVERVFRIRPVESVVVDAAQDEAFGQCAQEEIFECV